MAAAPPQHSGDSAARGSEARDLTVRVVSADQSLSQRLQDIWGHRELLSHLVRTEIKVKYKNSILGILWTMVAPAMTLAIYYGVFGVLLKNGIPDFVIFLASGLLIWNFFFGSVMAGTGVIVGRAGIVKKVSFPREILAIATVGSQSVYLLLQWLVLAVFMVALEHRPDWVALPLVVVGFVATVVWAMALAIVLSAVNVYFRDVQHLIEIVMQAWFWATPIVYSFWFTLQTKLVAHHLSWLTKLYFCNPMVSVVVGFQRAIYGDVSVVSTATTQRTVIEVLPPWHLASYYELLAGCIAVGLLCLVGAIKVFGRLEGNFAEEL